MRVIDLTRNFGKEAALTAAINEARGDLIVPFDADLQRLGERFFRVAGHDESGSGLGWSIVRRIAAAHHTQLAVTRSAALGGLEVRVSLHAAREQLERD